MAQQTTSPAQSDLLKEWSEKSLMNRLLLPGDLLDQVNADSEANLTCHKTTTEYRTITDSRQQKTIKLGDMDKYSTNFSYRPSTFENETVRLVSGAQGVECHNCSGSGRTKCSPTMACHKCWGSGTEDVDCTACNGTGRVAPEGGGADTLRHGILVLQRRV